MGVEVEDDEVEDGRKKMEVNHSDVEANFEGSIADQSV